MFAKRTIPTIRPTPLLQAVISPKPILKRKPHKELILGRCPKLPHRGGDRGKRGSEELSMVGGGRRVDAIIGEVPRNLVLHVLIKRDLGEFDPKGDVLANMLYGENRVQVNLGDPTMIGHGLVDFPILSSGDFVYERGDVDGLYAIKPRRLPKKSLLPIAHHNGS
jgi:hypothetical protein